MLLLNSVVSITLWSLLHKDQAFYCHDLRYDLGWDAKVNKCL